MKISKSDLISIINEEIENILNEEAYDCMQDYKAGTLTWEEYQACLEHYRNLEKSYTRVSVGLNPQSVSYKDRITVYLMGKENNFLRSVLHHLNSGKNISRKQKPIVDEILGL